MEDRPEGMSLMLKDHLVTPETMHVSNAANKDISLAIVPRGSDATITTPISSTLTTMIKSTMTITLHNNQSTLLTTSKPDLPTSRATTKLNWQKKWA